jgi:hypothetical protein
VTLPKTKLEFRAFASWLRRCMQGLPEGGPKRAAVLMAETSDVRELATMRPSGRLLMRVRFVEARGRDGNGGEEGRLDEVAGEGKP